MQTTKHVAAKADVVSSQNYAWMANFVGSNWAWVTKMKDNSHGIVCYDLVKDFVMSWYIIILRTTVHW